MIKFSNVFFALLVLAVFSSCGKEETPVDTTSTLTLSFTGLEDLGADYAYEGWIMVDGTPQSTGIFSIGADGTPDQSTFSLNKADLDAATAFILTIEPSPDADPAPSDVHVLAGDFSGTDAGLTVGHSAALGNDFSSAAGKYILATPTDGNMDIDETSGVWFLSLASGMPAPALELPSLPAGWKYEGWAVIDGTPVSTGTFTDGAKADDAAPFSGTAGGPPFPGEDFLNKAPGALNFPTDLSGGTVVISIEPSPDNSPNPFALKPLVAQVPMGAEDHVTYDMGNNAGASNPVGTAAR